MTSTCRRNGFTLIELLVVISIVAILIAILLPSLQSVKHHAKVLLCLSNLKQLGIGVANYVAESNYLYPSHCSIDVNIIYRLDQPWSSNPDRRPIFNEIAGNRPADMLFCPLNSSSGPQLSTFINQWSDSFIVHNSSGWQYHLIGYSVFFLPDTAVSWDWSQSGNPDITGDGQPDQPLEPGHSDAAIISDINWANPSLGIGTPYTPWGTAHADGLQGAPFQESNVLFGDGHGQTRGRIKNYVVRLLGAQDHMQY